MIIIDMSPSSFRGPVCMESSCGLSSGLSSLTRLKVGVALQAAVVKARETCAQARCSINFKLNIAQAPLRGVSEWVRIILMRIF